MANHHQPCEADTAATISDCVVQSYQDVRDQNSQPCGFETEGMSHSLENTRFMFIYKIMRHSIQQHQDWEPRRCPLTSCLTLYNSLTEMIHHLETCAAFTSYSRPSYWCPECGKVHRAPGRRLDLKTIGKSLKKCIDSVFDFPNPEGSADTPRPSSTLCNSDDSMIENNPGDLQGDTTMTSVGYPEFQTQSSPGFLPYPGYNFLGDFDNHDGSSSICSLPERPKVSIPQNGSLNQLQQTSPAGYSGLSASTAMFSASSANSEQTSWSIFDGSTVCPESTSPCTQCSQENDMGHIPIYGSNQITPISPYTTIPDEMHPRYADFSQGKAVVDATGQDNFNMNSFHVGMDAYSPSSDATPDSRGPFEVQVSLFSSDVPDMISKDSLAASTSNLYENHLAFEVGCSPSTEYPAIIGDVTKALEDWPLGSANSISRTDLSRTGDELEKPRCEFEKCPFEPQGRVKDRKSFQKMRSAVQKHMKRFHNSEVYECPFCPAVIKKRPDNLKDHIRKKHPKRFSSQYPGHEAKHDPNQGLSYGTPQRLRKKRLRSA